MKNNYTTNIKEIAVIVIIVTLIAGALWAKGSCPVENTVYDPAEPPYIITHLFFDN